MATLDIYNAAGKKTGNAEFSDQVFNGPVRPYLHTEVVNWQRACRRAGTQSALKKGEVSGSTKKPFAQKGRGMARQGSATKNPHQTGGGVAFAPKPRSYAYSMPKSKKRAALVSAISTRVSDGGLRIVEELKFDAPKTKNVVEVLKSFDVESGLFVDSKNQALAMGARNHPRAKFIGNEGMNVEDILRFPNVFLTVDAARAIESKLLGE